MTVHTMHLQQQPFEKIKYGKKRIEIRINDPRRRAIHPGDRILFINMSDPDQQIAVRVTSLHLYKSFENLFADLPASACGNPEGMTVTEAVSEMHKYYPSKERIKEFGVVGIGFAVAETKKAQALLSIQEEQ